MQTSSLSNSLLFSNAAISVRQKKLLRPSQFERMIFANTFSQSAEVLIECGYDEAVIAKATHESEIVNAEQSKTVKTFETYCPKKSLVAKVYEYYDWHNLRVLCKNKFQKSATLHRSALFPIGIQSLENLSPKMTQAVSRIEKIGKPTDADFDRIFPTARLELKTKPNATFFDTEFLSNWFIAKQIELDKVRVVLLAKRLGLDIAKTRELIEVANGA